MEELTILMMATAVNKTVTVVKAIGKDWNMVLTQVVVWVVGIVLLALAAHSTIAGNLTVFSAALKTWNGADTVLGGYVLGSAGSFAYDYKKARDNTDSSTEPALLAGPVQP